MKDTFAHRALTIVAAHLSGICLILGAVFAASQHWALGVYFLLATLLLMGRGIYWAVTGRHNRQQEPQQ